MIENEWINSFLMAELDELKLQMSWNETKDAQNGVTSVFIQSMRVIIVKTIKQVDMSNLLSSASFHFQPIANLHIDHVSHEILFSSSLSCWS